MAAPEACGASETLECRVQLLRAQDIVGDLSPDWRLIPATAFQGDGTTKSAVIELLYPVNDKKDPGPFRVRLTARLVPNRSSWMGGRPRVELQTELLHEDSGELRAFGSDHSDKLHTDFLRGLVQSGDMIRMVSETRSHWAVAKMSDPSETAPFLARGDFTGAVKAALKAEILLPLHPVAIQSMCDVGGVKNSKHEDRVAGR